MVALEDVIDLEARLAMDDGADPDALRRRDRAIARAFEGGPRTASDTIRAWLEQVRPSPSPGRRLVAGMGWMNGLVLVGGLVLGWTTATGLFAFREGGAPVNVGAFFGVTVIGQLGLLALAVLAIPLSIWAQLPLALDGRLLWRWLGARIARITGPLPDDWARLQRRLRVRGSLYGRVERWLVLEKTQLFMVAFNCGLLLCCLQLVLFTDLAFGWSTSASSIDANRVHGWTQTLASPWASWLPDAVPDLELIEKTRYSRLEGRYAGASFGRKGDPSAAAGWWPFLLMSIFVYGLLPRVALWSGAGLLRRRALSRLPVDSAELQSVLRRLRSPMVRTQAEEDPVEAAAPSGTELSPRRPDPGRRALLIRWRDHPTREDESSALIEDFFGWTVVRTSSAGSADAGPDEEAVAAAADHDVVVVLAEAWEAPDKSLHTLIRRIRARSESDLPIWVLLTGEDGRGPVELEQLQLWKRRLALLDDPYLGVEASVS